MSELKWHENTASEQGMRCIEILRLGEDLGLAYIQSHPDHGFSDDDAFGLASKMAAAEELYEALDELNELERGDLVGVAFKRARNNAIIKADRALAKARGNS